MNLFAYDNIKENKSSSTWIDLSRNVLISKDIKFKPYHVLLKKYNPEEGTTNYFIGMFNNPPEGSKYFKTIVDDYGRVKIYINTIIKDFGFSNDRKKIDVEIELIEDSEDESLYFISVV